MIAAIGFIIAFALGSAFGFWAGARQGAMPRPSPARTQLSRESVNDLFIRTLNESFRARQIPLVISGWTPARDGSLILEMDGPSAAQPIPVWQALNDAERQAMVAFIAVAYQQALAVGGYPPRIKEQGFPVLTLRYRGMDAPLATRAGDGRIYVYRSPYDGAPAPTR